MRVYNLIWFIQITAFITIWLDIPVARQIICFFYLLFIPGFLLLRIINIHFKDRINILLFSVGLSVTFLLIVGLLMNEVLPNFGVTEPLRSSYVIGVLFSSTLLMSLLIRISERRKNVCKYETSETINTPRIPSYTLASLTAVSYTHLTLPTN